MKDNLPQKYKESFFSRIFSKIKSFLFKKKETIIEEINTESCKQNEVENFKNEMNVDFKISIAEYEKREFMQHLKDDPSLLENFSIDRLKIILQYYLDENEKKKEQLKKLNA